MPPPSIEPNSQNRTCCANASRSKDDEYTSSQISSSMRSTWSHGHSHTHSHPISTTTSIHPRDVDDVENTGSHHPSHRTFTHVSHDYGSSYTHTRTNKPTTTSVRPHDVGGVASSCASMKTTSTSTILPSYHGDQWPH